MTTLLQKKGVTNLRRLNLRTIHVAIEAVVKRQFEEKHQKLREAACRSREATSTYVGYFKKMRKHLLERYEELHEKEDR